jgi:hypothetical protein
MTKYNTENMSGFNNQSTAVLRRWRYPGDDTDIPRAVIGTNFNSLGSDRFVEDGSFIRLKYITLRYNFNKSFIKRFKASDLSLYTTVENIYTWTKYTGQDPEVTYKSGDFTAIGKDESLTPPVKTITLGLSIRF